MIYLALTRIVLADSYGFDPTCQSGRLCRLRKMRPMAWLSRVGTRAWSIAVEVLEAIYERRWYCDHSTQIIFHDGDIIAYRVIESTGCFWKGRKSKWLRETVFHLYEERKDEPPAGLCWLGRDRRGNYISLTWGTDGHSVTVHGCQKEHDASVCAGV